VKDIHHLRHLIEIHHSSMLVKLAIAIHAIAAIASPVDVYKRQDPDTGLTWISKDSSLPKIM